jgi:hypothetical protein
MFVILARGTPFHTLSLSTYPPTFLFYLLRRMLVACSYTTHLYLGRRLLILFVWWWGDSAMGE